ncbi:MAG: sigma-70 family RNA polymerase sigma factor [Verrucomicrobiota bacterium]|jgi:RNA polymerase sigma-70 factor (ECF subfamily)
MTEALSKQTIGEPVPYQPGATTSWNQSWRQLYDHFANAIVAYARQGGLNDHSAQDVLQEVMMTLIRCQQGQAGYDPQAGTFQSWLWGIIRNRVRSVRRKDHKEEVLPCSSGRDPEELPQSLPEPSQPPCDFGQKEEDQWQQALLAAALRRVQARVSPENFKIYVALLEERATVEDLAVTYGKKPNAIYAVKHRCEEIFRVEARSIRSAWEQLRAAQPANCL